MAALVGRMAYYGLRYWGPRLMARGGRTAIRAVGNAAKRASKSVGGKLQKTYMKAAANRIKQINARTKINNMKMAKYAKKPKLKAFDAYTPFGNKLRKGINTYRKYNKYINGATTVSGIVGGGGEGPMSPPKTPYKFEAKATNNNKRKLDNRHAAKSGAKRRLTFNEDGTTAMDVDPIDSMPRTKKLKRSFKKKTYRKKRYNRKYKNKRSRKTKLNWTRGIVQRDENIGTVVDPDCLYLYFHDNAAKTNLTLIKQAILKKVFEKAFMTTYRNIYELVLSGQSTKLGAFPYKLVVEYTNLDAPAFSRTAFTIDQNTTIQNLANDASFSAIFLTVIEGNGTTETNNAFDFTRFVVIKNIYDLAGATVVDEMVLSVLNMQEEIIHLQCYTAIKIQNRTVGSSGSTNTDDVNRAPLEGFKYVFNSIPKYKYLSNGPTPGVAINDTEGYRFSDVNATTGLISIRGTDLLTGSGIGSSFKEPVPKNNFSNCKARVPLKMYPGALMKDGMSMSMSKPFNTFLKKMLYRINGNDIHETIGGGKMFCYEDMININTTYDITVTYQIDRVTKVLLTTKKKAGFLPTFTTTTTNNP